MRFAKYRPTPAMVVAIVALMVALGGTSYAAIKLPKNSVGTKQLKKRAVTSSKVKDSSLLKKDFAKGQLPAGPQGPGGPQGPAGRNGANGPAGTNGATRVTVRTAAGDATDASVSCVPGERATGGGGEQPGSGYIYQSQPTPSTGTPTGWVVAAADPSGATTTGTLTAYVVCASP